MNTFAPALLRYCYKVLPLILFFKSWMPLLIYVPANWPGQFSQIGWLGRASKLVTVKEHIGFEKKSNGIIFHHHFHLKNAICKT